MGLIWLSYGGQASKISFTVVSVNRFRSIIERNRLKSIWCEKWFLKINVSDTFLLIPLNMIIVDYKRYNTASTHSRCEGRWKSLTVKKCTYKYLIYILLKFEKLCNLLMNVRTACAGTMPTTWINNMDSKWEPIRCEPFYVYGQNDAIKTLGWKKKKRKENETVKMMASGESVRKNKRKFTRNNSSFNKIILSERRKI